MTKEQRNTVAEYAASLSEDELRFLLLRLNERLSGDLPEALNIMSRSPKMDALLQSTESAFELFDMLEKIRDVFAKEGKKKGVGLKSSPA